MEKIATHNSATGEDGLWWCKIFNLFIKTQNKTIKEQYKAGCRLFDIRVKLHCGEFRCGNGLWLTKKSAEDIFKELHDLDGSIVTITYEGDPNKIEKFLEFDKYIKEKYPLIFYGYSAIKHNNRTIIIDPGDYEFESKSQFLPLDMRFWYTYLPIPWLWKKIYNDKPKFTEDYYTYVDFL